MRHPLIALAIVAATFVTGCATQRVIIEDKPAGESRLFVTRSAENVTLSWESDPAMSYTVLYNHTRSPGSPWKVLPGIEQVRGTGRTMTYEDRVPVSESRYYRLNALPVVPGSP